MRKVFSTPCKSVPTTNADTPRLRNPLKRHDHNIPVGLALVFCLLATTGRTDAAERQTWDQEVGVPTGTIPGPTPQQTGKLEFTLIVVDKDGKEVTGSIKIPAIDKWPPPRFMRPLPGTCDAFIDIIRSRSGFQRAKAEKIANAINADPNISAAYKSYNPAKAVTVTQFKKAEDPLIRRWGGAGIYKDCKRIGKELPEGDWAMIHVPVVLRDDRKRFLEITRNELGEGGDGMRLTPDSGTSGGMGRAIPGSTAVATGYDGLGEPSIVEIGVKQEYVASLTPTPGMTDEEILLALESSLNRNGIPESFDSQSLTLNIGVPAGKTFLWGNTDSGLDFSVSGGTVLFPQCPQIGSDTGCRVLITVNEDDTVTVSVDTEQGGFDPGHDNVLIGVENHSSKPVLSLHLSGPSAFAFDNDGLCSSSVSPRSQLCPFGPTTYEGPGTTFTVVNSNNGTVNFLNGGIPPGKSAHFSLENPPVAVATQ